MERLTFRLPEEMKDDVDRLVEKGRYANRSAAFRDGVRLMLNEQLRSGGDHEMWSARTRNRELLDGDDD